MIIFLGILFIAITCALWNWTMMEITECIFVSVLIIFVMIVILCLVTGKDEKNK
ncbi:MAG: hypothetical protein IKU66_01040 [Clostridia bacterium]|nr:hypothetical protein [Clostridia bacterium]